MEGVALTLTAWVSVVLTVMQTVVQEDGMACA